ncbi:MAG: stage II sporulation protein R [Clostridiales bacterium]|nr:stage II sporulation protein R [Clostridiales bacterium]
MSLREEIFTGLAALLAALLIATGQVRLNQESLADRVAPQVLRLHVLANSDSVSDQGAMLEVRSLVLELIRKWSDEAQPTEKSEVVAHIERQKAALTGEIDTFLKERGFSYHADMEITDSYFPPRQYGNIVLPQGSYDAVRIVLGKGDGHNWWCVLYPGFCFVKEACEAVPEETLAYLREHLNRDDCLALLDRRPDFTIRFRLFPFLNP